MIDQHNVKNVILDLGGVLVDIDPENTIDALKRIMLPDLLQSIDWESTHKVVFDMEVGNLNKTQFFDHFKKVCKSNVIEEEIVDAWNAMVLEFPHERVEMVKLLGEKYNLYLLSNTNVFHINCFESDFKFRYNFPMKKLFKNMYYSSEIGLRKPSSECFQYVLEHSGLKPEETLMVDDREDNCLAAESVGMYSLKVPENSGLEAVIEELL